MAQHPFDGFNTGNDGGDVVGAIEALASTSLGVSRPGGVVVGQTWLKDLTDVAAENIYEMYMYSGPDGPNGGDGIFMGAFDLDTGLFSGAVEPYTGNQDWARLNENGNITASGTNVLSSRVVGTGRYEIDFVEATTPASVIAIPLTELRFANVSHTTTRATVNVYNQDGNLRNSAVSIVRFTE